MPAQTSHNTLNLLETSGLQANAMISQLNEIFPPTNPTPDDTMEKIMYRSGQRSVVEWIINYMENNWMAKKKKGYKSKGIFSGRYGNPRALWTYEGQRMARKNRKLKKKNRKKYNKSGGLLGTCLTVRSRRVRLGS